MPNHAKDLARLRAIQKASKSESFVQRIIFSTLKKISRKIHKLNIYRIITNISFKPDVLSRDDFGKEHIRVYGIEKNNELSNPIKLYEIKNGRIDTDNAYSDCFFTENNGLVEEICLPYSIEKHYSISDNNIFRRYLHSPKVRKVEGTVLSLISGGGSYNNYYHWLFDALPRISFHAENDLMDEVDFVYVPNYSQEFKQTTLKKLGIDPLRVIDSSVHRHISADKIIASTHPNVPRVQKWICDFLRASFLKEIPKNIKRRRLYVSRKNASKRKILNEPELVDVLSKSFGFEMVFLEELSFEEQVLAFYEAEIIVSPHGAGLANLVFCQPETLIVELFPKNSYSDLYGKISASVKLKYSFVQGYLKSRNSNLDTDFYIKTAHVVEEINKVTK